MLKYFCDRCGKEMNKSYSHICYPGNSANLCIECFAEFLNWMKNKPVEDKPNENYWDGKAYIVAL